MSGSNTLPLPQPEEISRREREDAMGAYFMMFAAWGISLPLPFLNLVAAGIYYGLHKKKSRFIAFHALQSLVSQVPVTVANGCLLFWFIRNTIAEASFEGAFWTYLAFTAVFNLTYIITSVIALARAYKGNFFYFPLFGRWAFNHWYGPNAPSDDEAPLRSNLPPPVEPFCGLSRWGPACWPSSPGLGSGRTHHGGSFDNNDSGGLRIFPRGGGGPTKASNPFSENRKSPGRRCGSFNPVWK